MPITGSIQEYFLVFWAGVLVSFTPCVYPVMPITATFIAGANTEGSRWMGFFISLFYVLGIAITYCTLAVMAALTGKLFGQLQSNPWIFVVVGNVLIFFALVLFDIIPLPTIGHNVRHAVQPKNVWAIILLGAVSGLVIGPCTAPVLGSLLLYIGAKQNIIHGVILMFLFSYGVGASLILIGTFSGLLAQLPKSGSWLVRVKHLCGLILLFMAEYYLFKAGGLY